MDADQAYKNKIGQRLTETLLNAYENQKIGREDVAYLATYIREEYIEQEHDSVSIFAFIEQLSKEWPIFSNLLFEPARKLQVQSPTAAEDVSADIQKITSLIQKNDTEEKNQHI